MWGCARYWFGSVPVINPRVISCVFGAVYLVSGVLVFQSNFSSLSEPLIVPALSDLKGYFLLHFVASILFSGRL